MLPLKCQKGQTALLSTMYGRGSNAYYIGNTQTTFIIKMIPGNILGLEMGFPNHQVSQIPQKAAQLARKKHQKVHSSCHCLLWLGTQQLLRPNNLSILMKPFNTKNSGLKMGFPDHNVPSQQQNLSNLAKKLTIAQKLHFLLWLGLQQLLHGPSTTLFLFLQSLHFY